MKIIHLDIKPLSSNAAWQGRRFSTKAKKQFETQMLLLLPKIRLEATPYYAITYDFFLVNFARTDVDNLVKTTQDCIVKRGIISDDRLIISILARKFWAVKDGISIAIDNQVLAP